MQQPRECDHPNSVNAIGDAVFEGCSSLTSVSIPNSVTTIGASSFRDCSSLTIVSIPHDVTYIGSGAFRNCIGLTSITIEAESVPIIGAFDVFLNVSPDIPLYVPCGMVSTYHDTYGLEQFTNIQEDPACSLPHYNLYYKINGNSATVYGDEFYDRVAVSQVGDGTEVEIPSNITLNGTTYTVTSIGESAFNWFTSLTSVTIPNSVLTIGNDAFNYCTNLTDVNIPGSVITIGNYAFNECASLTSVNIGNSVTTIGTKAFQNCENLTNVYIGSSVSDINDYAFWGCNNLTDITIPNSVINIGKGSFRDCRNLTNVTLGESVATIGQEAFYLCRRLTNVSIPNSVTTIGDRAFNSCGLTNIFIPRSVTSIGNNAFYNNNLMSVAVDEENSYYDSRDNCNAIVESASNTLIVGSQNAVIPNTITSIGNSAFAYCRGLTSVIIPNSVISIGDQAFYECSALKCVTIGRSVSSFGNYAFWCSNLKTVINLSSLDITQRSVDFGYVAYFADRVVIPSIFGAGLNSIYQIPRQYRVVETEIPEAAISNNFIYSNDNGVTWKAKNIVLTDCQETFSAPVAFTAEHATFTRDFTDNTRSTLCLPFSATKPANLEAFQFASFNGGMLTFAPLEGNTLAAYTPYLVVSEPSIKSTSKLTFEADNAYFPATAGAVPAYTTAVASTDGHGNMEFRGVMARTQMGDGTSASGENYYGYYHGYFVQSDGGAHVNPFRCYFYWSERPAGAQTTLGVDFADGGTLGIWEAAGERPQGNIRYSNDVYDLMGRMVRKNADNLYGLPTGIYIWRGKKVINHQ